jgi:hypothetical protein
MRPAAKIRAILGCVAVAVLLTASSTTQAARASELDRAAADVAARLRQASAAAEARAEAIAAVPSLVYAVATDQQTMLDMTSDELSFHAAAGETVEVGQQQLRSGKVISLLREGEGALVHLPLDAPGVQLVAAGKELYAVAVVGVRPRERANVVRGVVGVAHLVDLAQASARLAELGGGLVVYTSAGSVTLGSAPAQATARALLLSAPGDPAMTLLVPPPRSYGIATAIALGLFAFALAFVVVRRRRRSVAVAAPGYDPPVDGHAALR